MQIGLENVKFLKTMLKIQVQLKRSTSAESEATRLIDLVEKVRTDGNMWASSLIECSKVFDLLA